MRPEPHRAPASRSPTRPCCLGTCNAPQISATPQCCDKSPPAGHHVLGFFHRCRRNTAFPALALGTTLGRLHGWGWSCSVSWRPAPWKLLPLGVVLLRGEAPSGWACGGSEGTWCALEGRLGRAPSWPCFQLPWTEQPASAPAPATTVCLAIVPKAKGPSNQGLGPPNL